MSSQTRCVCYVFSLACVFWFANIMRDAQRHNLERLCYEDTSTYAQSKSLMLKETQPRKVVLRRVFPLHNLERLCYKETQLRLFCLIFLLFSRWMVSRSASHPSSHSRSWLFLGKVLLICSATLHISSFAPMPSFERC